MSSPAISSSAGRPKNRLASASVKPAIWVASMKAETMSAFLIRFFSAEVVCAGRPKRMWIAASSRLSSSLYSGPTAAFTGEIMSPMTYSGASCNSAVSFAAALAVGYMRENSASTSSECSATE